MFLELKYEKCCNLLSHYYYYYYFFTFDRKCQKIIVFSKRDGLNMNGSSIGLGKNDSVAICNYCSKDVSVANMEENTCHTFSCHTKNSVTHIKDKKHVERSLSDQCIKSLMPPTLTLPLIILKICLSGVWSFQ